MIYKRLYNGNLTLRSLCGSSPCPVDTTQAATAAAAQLPAWPLDSAQAATAVAAHLAGSPVTPAQLWDIAHVLKQHAQAAVDAAAAAAVAGDAGNEDGVQGRGMASEADDGGLGPGDEAVQAAAEGSGGHQQGGKAAQSVSEPHGDAASLQPTSAASSGAEKPWLHT